MSIEIVKQRIEDTVMKFLDGRKIGEVNPILIAMQIGGEINRMKAEGLIAEDEDIKKLVHENLKEIEINMKEPVIDVQDVKGSAEPIHTYMGEKKTTELGALMKHPVHTTVQATVPKIGVQELIYKEIETMVKDIFLHTDSLENEYTLRRCEAKVRNLKKRGLIPLNIKRLWLNPEMKKKNLLTVADYAFEVGGLDDLEPYDAEKDAVQAIASGSAKNPLIEQEIEKRKEDMAHSVGIPLHQLVGLDLVVGEKKVGKITSAKRIEKIPEGVQVAQWNVEAEIVDEETLNDIKHGKHRYVSIGSNLENSNGVGEGSIE